MPQKERWKDLSDRRKHAYIFWWGCTTREAQRRFDAGKRVFRQVLPSAKRGKKG